MQYAVADLSVVAKVERGARVQCVVGNDLPPFTTSLCVNGKLIPQEIKLVTIRLPDRIITGLGFETEVEAKGMTMFQVFSSGGTYSGERALRVDEL